MGPVIVDLILSIGFKLVHLRVYHLTLPNSALLISLITPNVEYKWTLRCQHQLFVLEFASDYPYINALLHSGPNANITSGQYFTSNRLTSTSRNSHFVQLQLKWVLQEVFFSATNEEVEFYKVLLEDEDPKAKNLGS